ncbi:DUF6471 domain-containing protein [Limobrevibacterium gyesilva]|uniref:DUF6471 domain-containing protein n=1 Tax=Limobrevibacterium gyesilva TaxID=2991712 RepID=A0AA41YIU2_9PROT|nr:DUF6471 domain-containing protein [Limobrevibacterium gyesilva]MCW3474419.1 DUF6471 domain-containing protein [Limobrevibacterium gyesilva]
MAGSSDRWADHAKRHLKAELKRADVGYAELARRLTEMGLPETEGSVTVKINRGAFPAWFLFAVMKAIGINVLRVEEWF